MISFVRASEETFRTGVLDALAGKRVGRLLGEPTRRRPVLPRPALPRRPAVCCPEATRPWYVRVLDSTGCRFFALSKNIETSVLDAL